MKILTVYYSYGGNTQKIAEKIHAAVGGDIAEIQTVTPYTDNYDAVVQQGADEVKRGFMPPLKPLGVNPADYDIIVLGTPVWWYTFAPAVKTFLHDCDLSGKTVYPFATNGGWIGRTLKDIEKACPGADVKKGVNIRFDGNRLRTPERDIDSFIAAIGK